MAEKEIKQTTIEGSMGETFPPSSVEQLGGQEFSADKVISVPELNEKIDVQPPVTPKVVNAPYYGFPIPEDVQERLPTPIEANKRKREGLSPLY